MQALKSKVENVMDVDREKTAANTDNTTIEKGQSNTCPCLKASQTMKSTGNCSIFNKCVMKREKRPNAGLDVRRYSLVLLI